MEPTVRSLSAIALLATAPLQAQTFNLSDIAFWVGTGSDSSVLVVDFHDDTDDASYAWGFLHDGTATGADMLSADSYVQGGLGTQGFNRYSYAGNNPLKYTDPSGESLVGSFLLEVVKGVAIYVAVLVVPAVFVVGFGFAGSLLGIGGTVAGVIVGATTGVYVYSTYVAPWINGW